MTLRADHIAGGAFLALGFFVFAVSGDLPFGTLSAPGAGMMPKLVTGLMLTCAALIIAAGASSQPAVRIDWSDLGHATRVILITGAAIAGYQKLGFLITMSVLVFALLIVAERQNVIPAAAYSIGLTAFAYWLFGVALRSPLERGLLWF